MYILLRNTNLFDILVLTLWRQFFRSQPDAFLHYHESKQRESISNEFFSASLHLDFLSISKGIIIFVFCSEPFSNIVLRFLSQLFTAELRQQDQWCPRIIYQWKTALEILDRLIRILWAKQDPLLWDEQYEIVNGLNVSNHFLCSLPVMSWYYCHHHTVA